MTIYLKKGVSVDGMKAVMHNIIKTCELWFELEGVKFVITDAVRESKDGSRSLHPHGLAFDIRIRELDSSKIDELFGVLSLFRGYDVIRYKTHIHVEHDDSKNSILKADLDIEGYVD